MKKIKFLMIAMMAFTVCTMFTACGDHSLYHVYSMWR